MPEVSLHNSTRHEPLRDTPDAWSTLEPIAQPSKWTTYWSSVLRHPAGMSRMIQATAEPMLARAGTTWASTITRWNRVLGPADRAR